MGSCASDYPLALLMVACACLVGCGIASSDRPDGSSAFVEPAGDVGLDFVHVNGAAGDYHLFEIMGSGVGLLDYDGDGDLDLIAVQGGSGEPDRIRRDRLFRNDSRLDDRGRVVLRFSDQSEQAGLDAPGYGMGVATGDYDNDGRVDFYVTAFGPNRLWRNRGDGSFEDATERAGVNDERWSVSASFFDYDADGWLDLHVGNYVDLTLATSRPCFGKVRDYCSPLAYRPVPGRLFRNRGDGTFEDVTARSGIARTYGNGLGAVSADFDLDGRLDLYVANDGMANQLWMNEGNGRFRDTALLSGCALNEQGEAEAGMGVTAADYDGDGDEDIFLTHLRDETNTVYINEGRATFGDGTIRTRLGLPSKPFTGFGTSFLDYDGDGWLDVLAVNGAVTANDDLVAAGDPYPYHERNQLFRNEGDGTFREILGGEAGPPFERSEIGRGAAFGDVDNDGDVDVAISQVGGPVRLLLNQVGNRRHWIGLRAVESEPSRDALGAWIAIERSGRVLWRRVRTDGSYASASDPRVVAGLGEDPGPVDVRVTWNGGETESWSALEPDRFWTLTRGKGRRVTGP